MFQEYSQFNEQPIGFNSSGRPLYRKLPLTPLEKILNVAFIFCAFGTWIYFWVKYPNLPDQIPTHFDIHGVPDRFGSKKELFIVPGIGTAVSIFLQLVTLCPQQYNVSGIRITAQNGARIYTYARTLVRFISVTILILFFVILASWIHAIHDVKGLSMWVILICSVGFIFSLIVGICVFYKKATNT